MNLQPLHYHIKLRNKLKEQTKTWDWFSSVKVKDEQLLEFKTNLLKNTYRLDKESNVELYDKVQLAKDKLGLTIDVTIYQAQNSTDINAGISYLPGEAHIVLSGQIMKLLTDEELLSVIAHELSHVRLFSIENAEFEIADRIITAIANDYRSEDVFIETARLFRLYMELYCDRGSLLVTENLDAVLSSLIKINTGLSKVSVESYLKQAAEIFEAEKAKSEYQTHPENYIRVSALKLWHTYQEHAETKISEMIEGAIQLNGLDIFKQHKIHELTCSLIQLLLKPKWTRTTAILSLAKQYKNDFKTDDAIVINDAFVDNIQSLSTSIKEYLSYVLLDFALVDPTLEDVPMGLTFQLAEDLMLKEVYNEIVKKELKLGERKLSELQKKAAKALSEIKESKQEHLYED
jgi:Zn-dependent protease with chaperone function